MKPQEILEALKELDPENKDHWTQDGQPRLGAIGEGVTRQQVLEVAPLFSRLNCDVDSAFDAQEQAVTAQEQAFEENLLEIQAAKDEAEAQIKDAVKAKADADAKLEAAAAKLDAIKAEELKKDTRSPTQINMDYLRSEFNSRMDRALQQAQYREMLAQAGLSGKEVRILTGSVLDRNIAARVARERRGK